MSKRQSLKYSNENDWLVDAIEQERKKHNRPSINNTIESILVDYFNNKKEWLCFSKENYQRYTDLAKANNLIVLFDDGSECNYDDKLPLAILTHFREGRLTKPDNK